MKKLFSAMSLPHLILILHLSFLLYWQQFHTMHIFRASFDRFFADLLIVFTSIPMILVIRADKYSTLKKLIILLLILFATHAVCLIFPHLGRYSVLRYIFSQIY